MFKSLVVAALIALVAGKAHLRKERSFERKMKHKIAAPQLNGTRGILRNMPVTPEGSFKPTKIGVQGDDLQKQDKDWAHGGWSFYEERSDVNNEPGNAYTCD